MDRLRLHGALALLLASALGLGCATNEGATVDVETFSKKFSQTQLVRAGDKAFLIDPGYQASAPKIEKRLLRAGVDPASLSAIILTHAHHDHAGAAKYFKDKYGTPIVAGAGDTMMLAAGGEPGELCPQGAIAKGRLKKDTAGRYEPVNADIVIAGPKQLADIAGVEGNITLIPGHTAGSLIVVAGTDAFVGDLFRGQILGFGAAQHFYVCDELDNLQTIQEVMADYPDVERYHVGHFGPVSREELFRWFDGAG